ncbi:MAG: hypothetical protein ACLGSD_11415 [Acidobacteriota bacterium]
MKGIAAFLAISCLCVAQILHGQAAPQNNGYYPHGGPDNGPQDVSMIQLIANPQRYDGKRVRIIGFLHLEFEGDSIYLHREDFEFGITKNALWIDVPRDMTPDQIKSVNDNYVICTGTFAAGMHGHMGLNSGEVAKITRLQLWTDKPRSAIPRRFAPPLPPNPPGKERDQ